MPYTSLAAAPAEAGDEGYDHPKVKLYRLRFYVLFMHCALMVLYGAGPSSPPIPPPKPN